MSTDSHKRPHDSDEQDDQPPTKKVKLESTSTKESKEGTTEGSVSESSEQSSTQDSSSVKAEQAANTTELKAQNALVASSDANAQATAQAAAEAQYAHDYAAYYGHQYGAPAQSATTVGQTVGPQPQYSTSGQATDGSSSASTEKKIVPSDPPTGKVFGKCKWFDVRKGFGFVLQEKPVPTIIGQDIFCHQSGIRCKIGYQGMLDGQPCCFRVSRDQQGRLRADDVTDMDGSPISGHANTLYIQRTQANMFPPHTTDAMPAGRIRGVVKWFDAKKGYGFITPLDGGREVFAHQTVIKGKSLADGENVEYTVVDPYDSKQCKAKEVTGPGGVYPVGAQLAAAMPQAGYDPYGGYGAYAPHAPGYGAYGAYPGYGAGTQGGYPGYSAQGYGATGYPTQGYGAYPGYDYYAQAGAGQQSTAGYYPPQQTATQQQVPSSTPQQPPGI